jgi:hypothetical protein
MRLTSSLVAISSFLSTWYFVFTIWSCLWQSSAAIRLLDVEAGIVKELADNFGKFFHFVLHRLFR